MRDLSFLRYLRGISKSDMERIRKANYKLRKSLAEEKADEPPTVLRESGCFIGNKYNERRNIFERALFKTFW